MIFFSFSDLYSSREFQKNSRKTRQAPKPKEETIPLIKTLREVLQGVHMKPASSECGKKRNLLSQNTSLAKTMLSRNFCQKSVRVNFNIVFTELVSYGYPFYCRVFICKFTSFVQFFILLTFSWKPKI